MAPKGEAMKGGADLPECFVMMPISDPEGYQRGHFERVYRDIFVPACEQAGFRAVRADEVQQTNLIQLDMLQRILNSPMALCDLSNRNPNVLFELGIRQAFDKPVVLVREVGTPAIFDIAQLRYTEYQPTRLYHEVLEDQLRISAAIASTQDAFTKGEGVNSIVRLLALTQPASLPEVKDADKDPVLRIIRAEMSALRDEVRDALKSPRAIPSRAGRGSVTTVLEGNLRQVPAPTVTVEGSPNIAVHVMNDAESYALDALRRGVAPSSLVSELTTGWPFTRNQAMVLIDSASDTLLAERRAAIKEQS